MNDNFLDDVAEIMRRLYSEREEALSPAEKIQLLEELQTRMLARKDEIQTNSEPSGERLPREIVPPEIVHLVGQVIIAASWTEDAGGMVLQAASGNFDKQAKGYGDTSGQLSKALKRVVPEALTARLDRVMKIRHFLVHGLILDGRFITNPHTKEPAQLMSMKRRWRSEAPQRDTILLTTELLEAVRDEFWDLENELEKLHSQFLFGKGNDLSDK